MAITKSKSKSKKLVKRSSRKRLVRKRTLCRKSSGGRRSIRRKVSRKTSRKTSRRTSRRGGKRKNRVSKRRRKLIGGDEGKGEGNEGHKSTRKSYIYTTGGWKICNTIGNESSCTGPSGCLADIKRTDQKDVLPLVRERDMNKQNILTVNGQKVEIDGWTYECEKDKDQQKEGTNPQDGCKITLIGKNQPKCPSPQLEDCYQSLFQYYSHA